MAVEYHTVFLFFLAFVFVVFIRTVPVNCSLINTKKSPTSYLSSNDADTITNMLQVMDLLQVQIEKQHETLDTQATIIQHLINITDQSPASKRLRKELPLIVVLAVKLSNILDTVQAISSSLTKQENKINDLDTDFKLKIEMINQNCSNGLQKTANQVAVYNKSIAAIEQSLSKLSSKDDYKEKQLTTLSSDLNTTKDELNSLQNTVSQDQFRTSDHLASLSKKYSSISGSVSDISSQTKSNITILDSRVHVLEEKVNSTIKQSLSTLSTKVHDNKKQLATLSSDLNTTKDELTFLQNTISQDQLRTSDNLDSLSNKYSSMSERVSELLSQLKRNRTSLDSRVSDLEEAVNSTIKHSSKNLFTNEQNNDKKITTLSNDLNTTQNDLTSLQSNLSQEKLYTSGQLDSLSAKYSSILENVSEIYSQWKSNITNLNSRIHDLEEEVNSTIKNSLTTLSTKEHYNKNQLSTLSNDLNTTKDELASLRSTVSQDQLHSSDQLASLSNKYSTISGTVSEMLSRLESNVTSLDLRIHNLEVEVISSVRLVGGNHTGEGRVEVYYHNAWGTVCDDAFTDTNAQVVCRQLGYAWTGAIQKQASSFGKGSGATVLDDVSCRGPEKSIASCVHNGFTKENCIHTEDVGVVCFSVRLTGGWSSKEGTVVVKLGNKEGSVCDDDWDNADARVVCRMLGYHGIAKAVSSAHFGQKTGQIWMDNVNCGGNETSLAKCSFNGFGKNNCGHHEDAGVICQ